MKLRKGNGQAAMYAGKSEEVRYGSADMHANALVHGNHKCHCHFTIVVKGQGSSSSRLCAHSLHCT
jgi:hypothetical protein